MEQILSGPHRDESASTHDANGVGSASPGFWLTLLPGLPVLAFFAFAAFSPSGLAVPLASGKPTTIWFVHQLALDPPTLISMPLAFAVCIGVSLLDGGHRAEQDRAGYVGQRNRMMGGAALAAAE